MKENWTPTQNSDYSEFLGLIKGWNLDYTFSLDHCYKGPLECLSLYLSWPVADDAIAVKNIKALIISNQNYVARKSTFPKIAWVV